MGDVLKASRIAKKLVRSTGEMLEYDISTPEQMVEIWALASEYEKAWKSIKDQIKKYVPEIVNDKNTFEHGNYMFRVSSVQRQTFDKSVMRQVFDEDTLDLFLKPDPTAVKNYIKEHLNELGDDSTVLMNTMIPDGKPYEVIKLEKLTSDRKFSDET